MSDNTAVYIGLYNPKSPTNVGSVLRAAGCFQANGVYYTGIRFERAAKFSTDTKDTKSKIPVNSVTDLVAQLPNGVEVVCVELVEDAEMLPDFKHPKNAAYIFGPEDGSLPQDIIDRADHVVYIPTIGCMNLAATVNVVLYDRLAKSGINLMNEALQVKQNRDTNNRLVVKTPHP